MGWTCVRTYVRNVLHAYEWKNGPFSLSLSFSPVRLRAFKLDRVQVRPMADVAKLPCDSGFTLSRFVRLALRFSPSFLPVQKRKCEWEKTGKLGAPNAAYVITSSSRGGINKFVVHVLLWVLEGDEEPVKLKLINDNENWKMSVINQIFLETHDTSLLCHL